MPLHSFTILSPSPRPQAQRASQPEEVVEEYATTSSSMRMTARMLESTAMTKREVFLLVKTRFETTLGQDVYVTSVRSEGSDGWAVFVEAGGIVWRQRVSSGGVLGTCTAISVGRRKPVENATRLPGFQ